MGKLVLEPKLDERIVLTDGQVRVTVTPFLRRSGRGTALNLAIEAPEQVKITREEVDG